MICYEINIELIDFLQKKYVGMNQIVAGHIQFPLHIRMT